VWSVSRPGRFYPRERPGTHCTGGWVDPRAGLDRCGKSRLTGIRSPDLPARSESLSWLPSSVQYHNILLSIISHIFMSNFRLVTMKEIEIRLITTKQELSHEMKTSRLSSKNPNVSEIFVASFLFPLAP
jgi:hypothetical protein